MQMRLPTLLMTLMMGLNMGLITFDDLLQDTLCLRVDEMVEREGVKRGEKLYRHRFVAGLIKLLVEDFIENSKAGCANLQTRSPYSGNVRCKRNTACRFFKRDSYAVKST